MRSKKTSWEKALKCKHMLRLRYIVNYKQISAVFRSFYRTFLVLLALLVFTVLKSILFFFGQHICVEYNFDCSICILFIFYAFPTFYFLCFLCGNFCWRNEMRLVW